MKILAVISSANHEGYGAKLTKTVCSIAESNGNQVEYVYLYDLNYKSCGNCRVVSNEPFWCDKNDDLVPVLTKLIDSDALVWSIPVYMYNINGTAQTFFDRFCIFLGNNHFKADRLPGKKVVLILTSEGQAERNAHLLDKLESILHRIFIMVVIGKIGAGGFKTEDMDISSDLYEQAIEIGKKLI